MSLERDIAQIEESHENRRLAFNAKFWLDILPKDWFLSIFHKTDGNRRLAKLLDISEVEWHKRGADNVETLVRFYRKHLPHVVRHMSFWYMSRDNVKWRTPAEATALYALLKDRKWRLIELADESGAAIVPFWEIDVLPRFVKDHLLEIEDKTKWNTECKIWLAAGYSRTPFLVRNILEQSEKKGPLARFLALFWLALKVSNRWNVDARIQQALQEMHKWVKMPDLYLLAWDWDWRRTSDGMYDPNSTHIYPTNTLWPNIDWDLMIKAIIEMLTHSKPKYGGQ
jgi:undecaprenyl diphosphate synthase